MDLSKVILVSEADKEVGSMEKLRAHQEGLLHRAFSIFAFNSRKEFLLQQRAMGKYHSEGLWSNTCCSHPAPGESLENAIHRRLRHEMGFDCELKHLFHFTYKCEFPEVGLFEHELDHVFGGLYEGRPTPNPEEAMNWRWVSLEALNEEVAANPGNFSFWFKLCYQKAFDQFFS